jgi:hypothetical protein
MMEATNTFETPIKIYQTTRRNVSEDTHLQVNLECLYILLFTYLVTGKEDKKYSVSNGFIMDPNFGSLIQLTQEYLCSVWKQRELNTSAEKI